MGTRDPNELKKVVLTCGAVYGSSANEPRRRVVEIVQRKIVPLWGTKKSWDFWLNRPTAPFVLSLKVVSRLGNLI